MTNREVYKDNIEFVVDSKTKTLVNIYYIKGECKYLIDTLWLSKDDIIWDELDKWLNQECNPKFCKGVIDEN